MKKLTDYVIDREGNAVVGSEVYIRKQSDNTLVDLFSDDGITPTANPTVTDNDGEWSAYFDNNTIKIQVYVGAVQQNEVNHFQHYDLSAISTFAWTILEDVDAAAVRSTIGLGTIATQAASSVSITGGSIAGITDLAIADGGTGASTAAAARTNLGLLRPIAFQVLTTVPAAAEVLCLYPAVDAFTIPADFSGSVASVIVNPTASFAIDVTRQVGGSGSFTTIGTITVGTGGAVTWATSGGTAKTIAANDVLKFTGDGDGDSTCQAAFNIKGVL